MKLDDIKTTGIIGSGLMGHGIAFAFALAGYPTMMSDVSDDILQKAMRQIDSTAKLFLEEGLISAEEAEDAVSRIKTTTDLVELASRSDFVTEAIVERSQDKRELFNALDRTCPSHTIIASNTSSLVLSDFASNVDRQDKLAVTHYFAPPAIVPGVEVAKGPGTTDETYDITCQLMERINHVPIRVLKELPGYLLNRIQNAMRLEADRLWAEGVATAEDIDRGIRTAFGFRMPNEGPMLHYDLAGIWRWPDDVRIAMSVRGQSTDHGPGTAAVEKIRRRYAEGTPWLVAPEDMDRTTAARDREYVRRLKAMYWRK